MTTSRYIEDIFETFYKMSVSTGIFMQPQDSAACYSFYNVIVDGDFLTENQQRYIIRILEKYKMFAVGAGVDYRNLLTSPEWKNPTRLIDLSKKVWVEEENGHLWLQFKFPYQLKDVFEKEIVSKKENRVLSIWNHERKLRSLSLYNANLICINEFVTKHRFEIDESFMRVLSQWEEILDQEENISLRSEIVDNRVVLVNATESAKEYWQKHHTCLLDQDIMLAKSLGYLLANPKCTAIETIAAQNSLFWVKSFKQLFDLYNSINGRICIVLDRAHDSFSWLKQFIDAADQSSIDRSDIKVCFREGKHNNVGFNEWVKSQGLGGSVEQGKILIFQHKPAKWLFKDQYSVKMLVTNNLYPPTNTLTREWLEHHPCSIFLGDTKPSQLRNKKIVQL